MVVVSGREALSKLVDSYTFTKSSRDEAPVMKSITRTQATLIVGVALVMCLTTESPSSTPSAPSARNSWDKKAAATYLDRRMDWWMSWPGAARDHQTFCISCHTVLPYALSRSALREALGQQAPAAAERRVLDNVIRRVHLWNEAKPFYGEHVGPHKAVQSRGQNLYSTH